MTNRKRFFVALGIGFGVSATLFAVSHSITGELMYRLYWLQAIGFWATWLLRGFHSATDSDVALIGIPVNGLLYALFIFCTSWVWAKFRK